VFKTSFYRGGWARAIGALLLYASASPVWLQRAPRQTSAGTAPADWATYCWLDFSTYNDTLARSAGGQPFTFTLADGSNSELCCDGYFHSHHPHW